MGHKVVRKCSCLEMTTSLPLSNSLARAGHIPHHSRRGGRTDKRPRSTEGEKSSSSLMNTRGSTVSSGALWSGYTTLAPTYGSFIPALITRAAPPSLTSSEFPDTTSVQEVAVLQVSDIATAIPLSNRLDEQEGSPPCCFYWGPYPGRNTQNQAWRNPAQSTARPLEKNQFLPSQMSKQWGEFYLSPTDQSMATITTAPLFLFSLSQHTDQTEIKVNGFRWQKPYSTICRTTYISL